MQRLIDQHCDLASGISATEAAVRVYPPAPQREDFLASLARLHPDWRACHGADKASAEQRIAGCGAVINGGGATSEDLAEARFTRGGVYLKQDQIEQAIADYTVAIALKPNFAEAFLNRGNAYDDAGARDQALHDYDEALRINPSFAMAYSNRGLLYDEKGEHDRAVKDYDQALRLEPKYLSAIKNRARARFYQGDFVAATQDFTQALSLNPTDAYVVLWLDLARDRAGQASQDDLRRDAGALSHSEWPWPLVAAFLDAQAGATCTGGRARIRPGL